MTSLYWLIALFSGIYFWIYAIKRKKRQLIISEFELVLLFLVSRATILTQITVSNGITFNFLADLFVLYALYYILKQNEKSEYIKPGLALYITNPLVLSSIITMKPIRIIVLVILGAILFAIAKIKKYRITRKNNLRLLPAYLGISIGGYITYLSRDVLEQKFSQLSANDPIFPILLIIGVFCTIVTYIYAIVILCGSYEEEEDDVFFEGREEIKDKENVLEELKKGKLTKKDWKYILILTGISILFIYTRLGSNKAPETVYTMNSKGANSNTIVLEFEEPRVIKKLNIYLGYMSKRKVQLSYYDMQTEKWSLIEDEKNIGNCFCWNEVDISRYTNKIKLEAKDEFCYINEIVVIGENNEYIKPINTNNYEELFDEQEKYPKVATYYYRMMFDEIYHGRTAYETLHGTSIYEISHPPLGKDIMAIGVALFGMTPFGWRFIVAFFGVLLVPVFYAFLKKLTKETKYAVAGTILLCADFMHFTLSRIATIDAIVAFFVILAFYFMYSFLLKEKEYLFQKQNGNENCKKCIVKESLLLLFCGISMGCGMATKWTGIYAAAGLAILLFVGLLDLYPHINDWKQHLKHMISLACICVVCFIIIPVMIYVLSYIPYTKAWNKGLLQCVIENAKYMFSYHEKTIFEHPYSSNWYEWAWIKTPLFDAVNQLGNGKYSFVATFGNPIIWWSGIVAIFYHIYLWMIKKDKNAKYLCICYLTMLAPWIVIKRTVFIYQYYIPSIIMILMIGNACTHIRDTKNKKIITYVAVCVIVFFMFYPVISGLDVSKSYVNTVLKWLSSWTFMNYGN